MKKEQKVTPWEVSGSIDYDRLIRDFGVQYITEEQLRYLRDCAKEKGMEEHLFLRRGLFFAQMDLGEVLDAHKQGKEVFLYTGRAPGGVMHIGHFLPFLFTKFLQDVLDCPLYIQIPDDEKFLFKKELTLEQIDSMVTSDLLDIAAIGFDPEKTFIFKNSEYIRNMYPLYLSTAKKITYSQARNTFGFEGSSNIGQVSYPALQIVPTFFQQGYCLIPCAIDQNPYFLLQRDIAEKLGYHKNTTVLSRFLTPLTGPDGKMSSSEPEKAILLSDTAQAVKKKVNKYAFSGGRKSIEEHREQGGDTSIDVAFQWLYFLFEEDDVKIKEIKDAYESGEMLSGELKQHLISQLGSFLERHQEAKSKIQKEDKLRLYMYEGTLARKMWNTTHVSRE